MGGYSSDLLTERVEIWNREEAILSDLGRVGGDWKRCAEVWAGVTWNKGAKSLREGAIDAYDTIMVRMRWRKDVDRWTRIQWRGKMYEVTSLQGGWKEDKLQLVMVEIQKADEGTERIEWE